MTENLGDDQSTAPLTTGGVGTVPPTAVEPADGSGGGRRRGFGDVVRTFVRGVGQTLITVGLVLLLFVVYEVWVSNLFAHQKQTEVRQQLAQSWQQGQDPLHGEDRLNLPSGKQVVIPAGEGFANLYIPRFGKDFAWTVVQGTDDASLERGPGHYTNTAVPGVGKGEPFLNLDQLVPGDAIVVQTAGNWYVYRVLGNQAAYAAALKQSNKTDRNKAIESALSAPDKQGVVGREIVNPSDIGVIDPVPNHPNTEASRALLTLTTCHPKYTANQRMIIHASLARAVPAHGSAIPKELPGGTL
jgi:sortase A